MTEDSANQTTLGHDVFVSYASQDAAVANSIVENLEQHGLKCWIAPRDVKPGAQYADAIVRAINEAKARGVGDVGECGGVIACGAGSRAGGLQAQADHSRFESMPRP